LASILLLENSNLRFLIFGFTVISKDLSKRTSKHDRIQYNGYKLTEPQLGSVIYKTWTMRRDGAGVGSEGVVSPCMTHTDAWKNSLCVRTLSHAYPVEIKLLEKLVPTIVQELNSEYSKEISYIQNCSLRSCQNVSLVTSESELCLSQ
jgi:hypothetical protein